MDIKNLLKSGTLEATKMSDKQPHKYAAIMAELVSDLAIDAESWKTWQYLQYNRDAHDEWITPKCLEKLFVAANDDGKIRRKPTPKEYILIGDIRVPAPCRDIKIGQEFYLAGCSQIGKYKFDTDFCTKWLNDGRIHLDRETAQAHVDAEKKVNTTVMTEET